MLLLLLSCSDLSETKLNNTLESSNVNTESIHHSTLNDTISKDSRTIQNGIYFSNKKCDSNKTCKTFSPEKIDGKYVLSRNQGSNEATYYLLVKDDSYYLYSLQFLGEEFEAVASWTRIHKEKHNEFKATIVHQVMGSDYMGRYDNQQIEDNLNNPIQKSGLLKIGDFTEGNELSTNESIKLIPTDNSYEVDCKDYVKKREEIINSTNNLEIAIGMNFYYDCIDGKTTYFRKVN